MASGCYGQTSSEHQPVTCSTEYRIANLGAVCEAKGIEVWNTDIGAVVLHPDIRRHLARDLLINGAGVVLLGEPMGQRTAKDKTTGAERGARLDVDKDAEVEAALDPCV